VIEVRPLAADEGAVWDDLLRSADGLLYHSIGYRDLLLDHLGCEPEYLVADRDGTLEGVLPMMWSSGKVGDRVLNSLPFYGSHGGPVAKTAEAHAALLAAWDERATDGGTAAATLVANPFAKSRLPEPAHTHRDSRISQVTTLPAEPRGERILELIDSSARRNVRKADRAGFGIDRDANALTDLWEIHDANMAAIGGLAKPRSFFEAVPRHFRDGEDFDVWVARADGRVVAGLLVFYFNQVAEYFTPAVEHDRRPDQPLALILVDAMAHAATIGTNRWNWGGTWSTQDGVYRFKRKWGAEDGSYTYYVQVNDPSILDSSHEELRDAFPNFYVVPFSALKGGS
jgi:hypothetical protein